MAIIKKKDLKNFKSKENKEEIDELVDADGSPIEGDEPIGGSDSQIKTAPQQTTDDFVAQAIQPRRSLGGVYGYGTRRVGEEKMISLLNNIMENGDINNNQIPDIQDLSNKYQKPVVASKAQEVVDTVSKNNLNSEEIAILLNFIISNINTKALPPQYRNILKNQI